MQITLELSVLVKIQNTEVQSLLTKAQRQKNVKNAYQIKNAKKIQDKKIILFDDVYTTGATANECKRILEQVKVKEVLILTLAKD